MVFSLVSQVTGTWDLFFTIGLSVDHLWVATVALYGKLRGCGHSLRPVKERVKRATVKVLWPKAHPGDTMVYLCHSTKARISCGAGNTLAPDDEVMSQDHSLLHRQAPAEKL
jgi:hypothetical protein